MSSGVNMGQYTRLRGLVVGNEVSNVIFYRLQSPVRLEGRLDAAVNRL